MTQEPDAKDHGPTDRNSFRYGVASGLWAAAAIARKRGRSDIADEIEKYERATTAVSFVDAPRIPEMTLKDFGYGEMQPEDLGLTDWLPRGRLIEGPIAKRSRSLPAQAEGGEG